MVKKMISRLSVLVVLIVFLAACSKTSEYTNAIPTDAIIVASINLKMLADKAGLNDKENEALKQKLTESIKSGASATAFEQLEKILQNPNESGLDFKAPLYIFASPSFPNGVIVGKISSKDKAVATVEAMIKEQLCQPIEEADGYSYTLVENRSFIAFNETTIIMVATNGTSQVEEAKNSISNLFKQTADNSISQNAGFQKMQKQKGEFTFFISIAAIPRSYSSQLSTTLPPNIDLKDLMMLGSISFEKGKIAMQMEAFTENKEIEEILKKQNNVSKKINNSFIKYFPESTLAFLNIGIDGEALYNKLLETEEFRSNVSIAKAAEVKNLFSSFNGDISIGLLNVDMMKQIPTILAYADVKNGDALKTIYANRQSLGLKGGEEIILLSENEYVYKSRNINVFFGVKGEQMYATTDEMTYKNISKTEDKSIKDAQYASDMKNKSCFFVINMEAIFELPIVKMMMGYGGEEQKMYSNLTSNISYFEITVEEVGTAKMDLVLKNKETNALKQIIDFAKQFAGM